MSDAVRGNKLALVDRLAGLVNPESIFKNPDQLRFVRQLVDTIRRTFTVIVTTDSAVDVFMLRSPAGKIYRVTVADDGTLATEYVQG